LGGLLYTKTVAHLSNNQVWRRATFLVFHPKKCTQRTKRNARNM